MVKHYLGDGVYFDYREDHGDYALTTENGVSVLQAIYLDKEIIEAIFAIMKDKEGQ